MAENQGLLRLSINNREVRYRWDFDSQSWKPIEVNDGDDEETVVVRVNELIGFQSGKAGLAAGDGNNVGIITRLLTPLDNPKGTWQVEVNSCPEPLELTFSHSSKPICAAKV